MEHQLYARVNLRRSGARTLFVNPSLFHHMDVPRDQSFTVFAAVIGLHEDETRKATTLSIAPAIGWTERPRASAGDERSALGAFVILSGSFSLHSSREH